MALTRSSVTLKQKIILPYVLTEALNKKEIINEKCYYIYKHKHLYHGDMIKKQQWKWNKNSLR